jgi:hypothetical protein
MTSQKSMDLITALDEEDEIVNEETITFHSNVRENIVSVAVREF